MCQAGVQALFVTVDAPQLGRREKDMRWSRWSRMHVVPNKTKCVRIFLMSFFSEHFEVGCVGSRGA